MNATLFWGAMCSRFLKFIPSEEAFWLMHNKPNAFRLLTHIANTARRTPGHPDGLLVGQCHLRHWNHYKMTEREYRTAKDILVKRKHIIIIETNRTRQKSTTGTTTGSTLVQIISSTIYDINSESNDDRIDDRATTDRRLTDDKQEGLRMKKKDHPSIPSFANAAVVRDDGLMTDDSSSSGKIEVYPGVFMEQAELEACVKVKGDVEQVKYAVKFIMESKKRKRPISDWPNALANWKIENKAQTRVQDHKSYSDGLCSEFDRYENGRGWRCRAYHDKKKDQKGLLFESERGYQEPFFVAHVDAEFKRKCEDFILAKKMRKK
jgi:hypothetical protein